ncbi:MAG TPA: type II toxin-antitoxin system VapC family toxin [Candidatus Saccharimonadales bacterium]|nr:type II toxin-antitoxin system VapC family toxin [Candidatus Saccharimonadales bacterium]
MNESLFDTNIIIDHMRGLDGASDLIEKVRDGSIVGYISIITEAELFVGKEMEDEGKRAAVVELLSLFNKIDVNESIARIGGEFRRKYGLPFPDALIAATAFIQRCRILTANTKDFDKVKEVKAERPYDYG